MLNLCSFSLTSGADYFSGISGAAAGKKGRNLEKSQTDPGFGVDFTVGVQQPQL